MKCFLDLYLFDEILKKHTYTDTIIKITCLLKHKVFIPKSTYSLRWSQDLESPEEIETFAILEGKYLSDSIKPQTHHRLELINWIPEVNLQLYKIKMSNKYICTIKNYNLVLSSEIVELLRQYLTVSTNVLTIQTKALVEYQTMETFAQDCIIRTIRTSKVSKGLDIEFPKLEQPNIISGVSAGGKTKHKQPLH